MALFLVGLGAILLGHFSRISSVSCFFKRFSDGLDSRWFFVLRPLALAFKKGLLKGTLRSIFLGFKSKSQGIRSAWKFLEVQGLVKLAIFLSIFRMNTTFSILFQHFFFWCVSFFFFSKAFPGFETTVSCLQLVGQ